MEIQNILVPVDFSEIALFAMRQADDLAVKLGASLTLAHVHPITTVTVLDYTYAEPPEVVAEVCTNIEEKLRSLAETLSTPPDRRRVTVHTGDPAAELAGMSKDYDLIVMSTHGRTGVQRFLLGSVAERLVRAAACSVMVVRKKTSRD